MRTQDLTRLRQQLRALRRPGGATSATRKVDLYDPEHGPRRRGGWTLARWRIDLHDVVGGPRRGGGSTSTTWWVDLGEVEGRPRRVGRWTPPTRKVDLGDVEALRRRVGSWTSAPYSDYLAEALSRVRGSAHGPAPSIPRRCSIPTATRNSRHRLISDGGGAAVPSQASTSGSSLAATAAPLRIMSLEMPRLPER